MERERITISIKKKLLDKIDSVTDGIEIRNRSHAIEKLVTKGLGETETNNAVIIMGGKEALKRVPAATKSLLSLKENGFESVHIATGFLGDKIKDKLGDGSDLGITLNYSNKGEGSGGAIKVYHKIFDKTFVVFNTDRDISIDISKLIQFHKKHGAAATVATDSLEDLNGVYVIEPEVFEQIPNGFSMLESDIFPKLQKTDNLIVYPFL